jgi:hypothetical protein
MGNFGKYASTAFLPFGTMHIICADDAVLSDPLKAVIEKVDKICFEIDLDDAGPVDEQPEISPDERWAEDF